MIYFSMSSVMVNECYHSMLDLSIQLNVDSYLLPELTGFSDFLVAILD